MDDSASYVGQISQLVSEAVNYQAQLSEDRIKAVEYYDGTMSDTPPRSGWSKATTREVRTTISKALPSFMRTIFGSDIVAEFRPTGQEDEDQARQVTDYMNSIVLQESGAIDAIHDAAHDAMLQRNGILHWYVDKRKTITGGKYSGLDMQAMAKLILEEGVEIVEQNVTESENGPVYDLRIKREKTERKIRLSSVPLDEFLIHPDALAVEDAVLCGKKCQYTRSDLIAMGYDPKEVNALPNTTSADEWGEKTTRRRNKVDADASKHGRRENERLDYYNLYVRLDKDGDGISELRNVVFAGGLAEENLLYDEYADDVPFADVVIERRPHQWEGVSIADDTMDIQRICTALTRYALDNVYWQNTTQPVVQMDNIENPEALFKPEFGKPIIVKSGFKVSDVVTYNSVPFVAGNLMEMMQYWTGQAGDRTGIDDDSGGLPPDALQNVTAKASAMAEQRGIARVEMLVRNIAKGGMARALKGLLKLVVENQDKPRSIRLRNDWVDMDPRGWNAGMDVSVNTGLGAGTRERDMMAAQFILTLQEKMLAGFGPDNPFVKPENVNNALKAMVTATGLRTHNLYFTEPDEEEVKAKMEAMANAKPIELQKIEAQAMADKALKEAELPFEVEKARIEMAAAAEKERAQSQAAVDEAIAIAQIEAKDKEADRALKMYEIDAKIALEREKMENDKAIAAEQRQNDFQKHQAASMSKEIAQAAKPDLQQQAREKKEGKPKPRKFQITRDKDGKMASIEESA